MTGRLGLCLMLLALGAGTLRAQQGPVPVSVSTPPNRVPIASSAARPTSQPPADPWVAGTNPSPPAPLPPSALGGRAIIATTQPKQPPPVPPAPVPLPTRPAGPVVAPAVSFTADKPSPVVPPPQPPSPGVSVPDSLAPAVAIPADGLGLQAPPTLIQRPPAGVVPTMAEGKSPQPVMSPFPVTPAPSPAPAKPPVKPPEPPAPVSGPAGGSASGPLFLEKIGAESNDAGKPFRYEIVVRNPAATPLSEVRVKEELPPGARCLAVEPQAEVQGQTLLWDLGDLAAGAEKRLSIEVQPAGEGEFRSVATASCSASSTWQTRITRAGLSVTKKAPATAQVGDEVPFEIVVTNPGSGPATNVLIHDRLPEGLKHPAGTDIEADLGTLEPGKSRSITLKATAVKAGVQVNEVTVTADGGVRSTARAEVRVVEPGLQVRKTGPDRACLHHELEHRLEVSNSGQAPATSVKLTDALPEGLEFVSASDGGEYDAQSRTVSWTVGTLDPAAVRGVTVKARAKAAGQWVNKATARADRGLEATASATVTVEGVPGLMLEVADFEDLLEVGAETYYDIQVVNQGTSPVTGVAIRAILPDGLEYVRAEGPSAHHVQGREVTFEPLPKLAAKADAHYKIRVRAVLANEWICKVYLTADSLTKPVLEEESTKVVPELPDPAPDVPRPR